MNATKLSSHPGWQWCTAEGAELHSLLSGLDCSLIEKIQWLEEAENLTLALQAGREKALQALNPEIIPPPRASASPASRGRPA